MWFLLDKMSKLLCITLILHSYYSNCILDSYVNMHYTKNSYLVYLHYHKDGKWNSTVYNMVEGKQVDIWIAEKVSLFGWNGLNTMRI